MHKIEIATQTRQFGGGRGGGLALLSVVRSRNLF